MDNKNNETGILEKFKVVEDVKFRNCINDIMNTLEFRKLADKTQVIISLTGPNVRTRLTHTVEVAKIARDICKELKLNEDLAEAIALAHDIGHTPFGHVGERTLKEIMCGCDTLDDMVEFDFNNSGFKHNLQSFKILNRTFFKKDNSKSHPEWYYILWGVAAHAKMTWTNLESGEDNEILIHSDHCHNIHNCQFSINSENKWIIDKSCKLNKREYQTEQLNNRENSVCIPWYCAKLKDSKNKESNNLEDGWKQTNCYRKCYFAEIWEYRMTNNIIYKKFDFLFDHPFPNSSFAKEFDEVFFENDGEIKNDFVSIESFVVSEADEIAQRKQDLEDGLNMELITIDECIEEFVELSKEFIEIEKIDRNESEKSLNNQTKSDLIKKNIEKFKINIETIAINKKKSKKPLSPGDKNEFIKRISEELDDLLKKNLTTNIKYNFNEFVDIPTPLKREISSYDLFDLEQAIKKPQVSKYWISKEFISDVNKFENDFKNGFYDELNKYFTLKPFKEDGDKETYILHKIAGSINDLFKSGENIDENYLKKIISEIEDLPKKCKEDIENIINNKITNSNDKKKNLDFWKKLDDFLVVKEKELKKDDNRKREIEKCIFHLNRLGLYEFKILHDFLIKKPKQCELFEFYNQKWKPFFRVDASRILYDRLDFDKKDPFWKFSKNLQDFLKNTILKSEIVEKNDGKAAYIIKKLFEAYLTNPHQLPDESLISVWNLFLEITRHHHKKIKEYIELGSNNEKFKAAYSKSQEINELNEEIRKRKNEIEVEHKKISIAEEEIEIEKTKVLIAEQENEKIKKILEQLPRIEYENLIEDLVKKIFNKEVDINDHKKRFKWIKDCIIEEIELSKYSKEVIKLYESKNKLKEFINDEVDIDIKKIRKNIDNAILLSLKSWHNALTRGICDHIANLTDREAISEYEKLYFAKMEIV